MSLFRNSSSYETRQASPVTAFIVFAIIVILSLYFGISGLIGGGEVSLDSAFESGMDKGSIVSGVPPYGAPQANLDYEHGINSITIGHEYYYMILSEDQQTILLVRADKHFGENFDSESYKNINGTSIKGKVRMTSNDVTAKFGELTQLDEPELKYIDTTYVSRSIKWFIIAAINILLIIFVALNYAIFGRNGRPSGLVGGVIGLLSVAGMLAAGYLIIYNILLN